jgi:DNA polymerase-1
MKRVLIIDALNAYLRAYIVNPSLSLNGQPIGGIKGFFMILQKLVRESSPDEVMVIWDGPDGSRKRKTMDKNYKSGRKPIKLNRAFHNLTDDEELKNKIWQQTRLIEYLNEMPIVQAMIPQVEADDIIAYVSRLPYYKGWQKLIVSNDRDFMQVCDEETILLRPVKGEYLNIRRIVEQTGVHPTNMALARAIIGDSSDNLPGIRGVGFGTVKKRLGFLSEEKTYNVDDIIEHCESVESNLKFYSNIIEGKELIEHNYKMMQLYSPQMSIQSKIHVKESIENFDATFNKTEIIGMMREDGFGELNWEDLKEKLNRINYQYNLPQD